MKSYFISALQEGHTEVTVLWMYSKTLIEGIKVIEGIKQWMKLKKSDPSFQASVRYPATAMEKTNTEKTYTVQKKI